MSFTPDNPPTVSPCLTIKETAIEGRLSERQVYNLIKDKKLRARKIGRSTRILRSDFNDFLQSLPMAAA